jgi:signal transduction histidine kinase
MDETETESYFQPFHTGFSEGTGLGAAIVYRLIQEHGGRIGVTSRPGRGTVVRIRIPREAGAGGPVAAAPAVTAGAQGAVI